VKNVTGYDIPRLLVGSLGTLGVLTEVILRTRPRPECTKWTTSSATPDVLLTSLYRPACIARNGERTWVLLEGHRADVEAQQRAAGLDPIDGEPPWPEGRHRGRISAPPLALEKLGAQLCALDVAWMAEAGVGTVHVASSTEAGLAAAREAATALGGWLLRECGAAGLDPFGRALPNLAVMRRLKYALDPDGKLNRGRLPFVEGAA
jgi:FAD/FMN-containing dehydrogenase